MTTAALFVWSVVLPNGIHPTRKILLFLPGVIIGAGFLCWHYAATGWVGYYPDSPWAAAFQPVDAQGFVRNMAVMGWRFLDLGRFAEVVALGWLLWHRPMRQTPLFWLCLIMAIMLSFSALRYQNLSAHRYFLPVFMGMHLLLVEQIFQYKPYVHRFFIRFMPGAVAISLALGNLWVYPLGISMDWDSTLAHLPYHRLRADAIAYIDSEGIDFQAVGSAFPNLNTGEDLLLNGDLRRFAPFDLRQNTYILSANLFNDMNRDVHQALADGWHLKKQWKHASGVWIALYVRR
jgi:hypothetical protein